MVKKGNTKSSAASQKIEQKPNIALIADVENWAFHNYAKQISSRLSDSYNFQIFFYGQYPEIEDLVVEVKEFDLIHFFWRGALHSLLSDKARKSIINKERNHQDFITNIVAESNITTSVYDHLYLSDEEIQEQAILFNALSIGYTTCSQRLNSIYSSIPDYSPPNCVIENGIDLKSFAPRRAEGLYKKDEIIIGWAGNSKWGDDGVDHKGLETIIKPAIESLKAEGYPVRGYFADRQERWIPHSQMNDYYNSIDVYVCASDYEGSPDPILESMACGLPVISTDVGIVPEIFGRLQRNYILPERTVEQLKLKLIELLENPQKRAALSRENLKGIKARAWEKQCAKWDVFFKSVLSVSRNDYYRTRRNVLRKQALKSYLTIKSLSRSEAKAKKLQKELHNSKARASELDKWTIELQTALKDSQNRIVELENWTVELEKRIVELENWNLELQNWNLELQNRIAELERWTEELQFNLSEASEKNAISRSDIEKLQSKLKAADQEILRAQQIISAMEESRFWQLRNQWVKVKDSLPLNKRNT